MRIAKINESEGAVIIIANGGEQAIKMFKKYPKYKNFVITQVMRQGRYVEYGSKAYEYEIAYRRPKK